MVWKELLGGVASEVHLRSTLLNGQCFNWVQARTLNYKYKQVKVSDLRFIGVLNGNVLLLSQRFPSGTETKKGTLTELSKIRYRCLNRESHLTPPELEKVLKNYFQLEVSLAHKYTEWNKGCSRVSKICTALPGLRVVRQDPLECLVSFICSSNNNISRITQMLSKLRRNFGTKIKLEKSTKTLEKEFELELNDYEFYAFPTLDQLQKIKEQQLRDMGFGYRAKFITATVEKLINLGGNEFLENLRESKGLTDKEHAEKCSQELMQFHGVGRKVADCVALFSLDCTGCIPVDTHVWQIACRYYDPSLMNAKSLTPTVYERVNDLFTERFGSHAGWAHSVLFAAELPLFRNDLPKEVIEETERAKKWESELKEQRKKLKNNAKKPLKNKPSKSDVKSLQRASKNSKNKAKRTVKKEATVKTENGLKPSLKRKRRDKKDQCLRMKSGADSSLRRSTRILIKSLV